MVLASANGRTPKETGFYRIRPPLKPLTVGELAMAQLRSPDDQFIADQNPFPEPGSDAVPAGSNSKI